MNFQHNPQKNEGAKEDNKGVCNTRHHNTPYITLTLAKIMVNTNAIAEALHCINIVR